jgi:hypothetical protein
VIACVKGRLRSGNGTSLEKRRRGLWRNRLGQSGRRNGRAASRSKAKRNEHGRRND